MNRSELTKLFNEKFSRNVGRDNIKQLCLRRRWFTGRTGCFKKGHVPDPKAYMTGPNSTSFKKGDIPPNTKALYTERITKDGYIEIKIPEPNPYTTAKTRYRLKHLYLWEKEHGKIPEGHCLSFLDGNRANPELDNLELITRGENLCINHLKPNAYPKEMLPTIRLAGKLIAKEHERKRELK